MSQIKNNTIEEVTYMPFNYPSLGLTQRYIIIEGIRGISGFFQLLKSFKRPYITKSTLLSFHLPE